MPIFPQIKVQTLTTGGGTVSIDITAAYADYLFNGSGTLSGSWVIQPDPAQLPPTQPTLIRVYYNCNFTLSGNSVTICGKVLSQEQALKGLLLIEAIYDPIAAAFISVVLTPDYTPEYEGTTSYTSILAGGTVTLNPNVATEMQVVKQNGNLLGSWTLTSTNPTTAQHFWIKYDSLITVGAFAISIFGLVLTAEQALKGNLLIFVYWDVANAVWISQIIQQNASIDYRGVTEVPIVTLAGVTVTLTNGVSKQTQWLTGSGALGGNVLVTSTGTFSDGAMFIIKYSATATVGAFNVTILGIVLTSDQALYGDLEVIGVWDLANTAWRVQLVQNPSKLTQKDVFIAPVSFETLEQCNNSFIAPCNGIINQLDGFVTKALSATDAGTVTVKINGTAVTTGVLTFPLSSALNTQISATPSALNVFVVGDIISFVGAKTTVVGKVLVSATYTRKPL